MAACSAARRAARAACSAAAVVDAAPAASDAAALAASRAAVAASLASRMSARRFFCCRRRAAAEGALPAGMARPSQRQRSPSGETRRWPAEEPLQAGAVGAGDDADGGEAAGELGRSLDLRGEGRGAFGQGGGGVEGRQSPPALRGSVRSSARAAPRAAS